MAIAKFRLGGGVDYGWSKASSDAIARPTQNVYHSPSRPQQLFLAAPFHRLASPNA
ncbi:hypothetical protein H6F95_07695 [Cyanobacteria bacterium FACHB-471]|nr:hypothetical protein [Cyanobacteria bacterium FACHB-471]